MSLKNPLSRRQTLLAAGGLGLTALAGLVWRSRLETSPASVSGVPATAPPVATASAASGAPEAKSHFPFGPVAPRLAPPSVSLLGADGTEMDLAAWLKGKPTAVQLIFTRCTTTCPIQGVLFAAVARKLEQGGRILSLSIDPEYDKPAELSAWMARFGSNPSWYAASPRDEAGVNAVFDFLRGRAQGLDRHSLQVYLFDSQGQLAYRTADMPSATEVTRVLNKLT